MTPEEFGKKLKALQFRKVKSADGGRGYLTTIQRDGKPYDITCYAAPDMKAKKALDCAWDMMLKRLAAEYGYRGGLDPFR